MAVSLREVVSFGRYEPLFRIASGGMAEVYAARIRGEAGFQKLVAVKRMHPHLATDPSFVDMFLNEARLAAHIASPHVVTTLDLGRGSDGSLYIVMELVVGLSLASLEEDLSGPLPVGAAIEIIAQAAQGLDDAHEATTPAGDPLGLVHRDISPHNLLLGVDGLVRVTDFGIAHAVNRPRTETNVKELKGKFAYMSPEQTRVHALDRRSDVFSLGIVAWEALVGRRLFAGDDPPSSIARVRGAPIPAPHHEVREVPPGVSEVVLKALARDPEARFATAADFAQELRRAGRAALRELPGRREVGAFVQRAGGDELERLRRLIRLGTEGADADAIEAVQPGVTRVLAAGDLSGVARLGTGAKRVTAVLKDGPPSQEAAISDSGVSIPVVTLAPDGEPSQTMEVDVLSRGEAPTAILKSPPDEPETVDAEEPSLMRKLRDLDDPLARTRAWARPRDLAPVADDGGATTRPVALPEGGRRATPPWLVQGGAVALALAIVLFAFGVATLLLWPRGGETVPLPEAPPPEVERAVSTVPAASPTPAPAPTPSPVVTPVVVPAVVTPVVAPASVAPEGVAPASARRRARRGRRAASARELMGVEAFDRHTP